VAFTAESCLYTAGFLGLSGCSVWPDSTRKRRRKRSWRQCCEQGSLRFRQRCERKAYRFVEYDNKLKLFHIFDFPGAMLKIRAQPSRKIDRKVFFTLKTILP